MSVLKGLNIASVMEENFNAANYINEFVAQVKTGDELRQLQLLRKTLNQQHNIAAETIKDIVFDHYKHFMQTSKEILNLEREIYQLSSILTEQKNLIENLMEMNGQEKKFINNNLTYNYNFNSQNQLHTIIHKMDGVATILNNLKDNEKILLQGEMVLLNSNTMDPEHSIMLVLLNSSLLIGHPTNSNTTFSFKLVANYLLENLAVVNFKNYGSNLSIENSSKTEHVIQLLVFPDQIYLKCKNARQKREWLELIEQTKRKQEQEKSLIRQATIRAKRSKRNLMDKKLKNSLELPLSELTIAEDAEKDKNSDVVDTQWLNDLIEELNVIISDRHMEEAVEMLLEWKSCNCKNASINAKFLILERQVVQILSDEIRKSGFLHGGRQALKYPFALLIALGKEFYAFELYLRRRGNFLRLNTSELISDEPLSYVRQISTLFVNEIMDVVNEFSDQQEYYCLILQWSSGELSVLLSMIRKHVIEVAPTMTVLAHSWRILISNCDLLIPIGMDLSFEINRLLAPSLKNSMSTIFNNIIESVSLRIAEEKWKPFNLENEAALNRFLEEMSDLDLSIDWAAQNNSKTENNSESQDGLRYYVLITQSACHFARVAFSLSREFSLINVSSLEKHMDSYIRMLWCDYLFHLSVAVPSEVQKCTAKFIISQVIPLCDQTYQTNSSTSGKFLHELLETKFPKLSTFCKKESFDEEIANV